VEAGKEHDGSDTDADYDRQQAGQVDPELGPIQGDANRAYDADDEYRSDTDDQRGVVTQVGSGQRDKRNEADDRRRGDRAGLGDTYPTIARLIDINGVHLVVDGVGVVVHRAPRLVNRPIRARRLVLHSDARYRLQLAGFDRPR